MCLQVVSELSASYASLVDVIGMSANVTFNNGEAERVHALSKQWAESMTHVFERHRYKNKPKKNNKKNFGLVQCLCTCVMVLCVFQLLCHVGVNT